MSRAGLRKTVLFAAKATVTGALIWLVFRNVDMADVLGRVRTLPLWVAPAVIGLILCQFLTGIWRWRILIGQLNARMAPGLAARLFFEGQFFNQALPSTVGGDGVRMYRAYRNGLALEPAVSSVILDRVVGLTALVLLVAAAQPMFYERVADPAARIAFTAIFAVAAAGIVVLLCLGALPQRLRHLSVVRGLISLSRASRAAFSRPAVLAPVLLLSVAGHLCIVAVFFVTSVNLGLGVTFLDCLVMVPSVLLLATVPISVAGWGVREGAMVTAFGLIGVPPGGAAAVSVLFGFALIAASLPGGVLWLMSRDRTLHEVDDLDEIERRPV
jgi:uncharacterized membrane protein YbhN (UPF0104 family)